MSQAFQDRLIVIVHREGGQRAVAERLGCNQATISRLLNGDLRLTARVARALAEHYPDLKPLITDHLLTSFLGESDAPAAVA